MDFLSDQLFDGSKIRILTIVDAFSKVLPAIDVRQRYRGSDVVDTLEQVTAIHGLPKNIRVDNVLYSEAKRDLVSVRKVLESYESDVIQRSSLPIEDKTDVDIPKPRLL